MRCRLVALAMRRFSNFLFCFCRFLGVSVQIGVAESVGDTLRSTRDILVASCNLAICAISCNFAETRDLDQIEASESIGMVEKCVRQCRLLACSIAISCNIAQTLDFCCILTLGTIGVA